MNTTPKLSIIVPVYNVEQYLRECLDSIKNQTFADFEVLMIDDGSSDDSGAICEEYAAKDARFRAFHKENGGLSSARNVGLDNVRGEWVAFLDSDDYLVSNNAYEDIFRQADNGNFDLIYFGLRRGAEDILPSDNYIRKTILDRRDIINNYLHFYSVCLGFFKKEKLGEHRFVNGLIAEDMYFTQSWLLEEKVKSVLIINKAYMFYRQNMESIVNIYQPTLMKDMAFIVSNLRSQIENDKIQINRTEFNEYSVGHFLNTLIKQAKYKDTDYLTNLIIEYAPKFDIPKIISYDQIYNDGKPKLIYLFFKLKLYKLAASYIKRKWG